MTDIENENILMHISRLTTWTIAAALLLLLAGKVVFIGYYRVPQNGMYPGIPAGSTIFTWKRAYSDASHVNRGDTVVFLREERGQQYVYIWRVIGLPGDTITTGGESLTINGQPVLREHLRDEKGLVIYRENIGDAAFDVAFSQSPKQHPPDVSVTVPPEHFFMMGDNRFDARDSRYFGPVPFNTFVGRKF